VCSFAAHAVIPVIPAPPLSFPQWVARPNGCPAHAVKKPYQHSYNLCALCVSLWQIIYIFMSSVAIIFSETAYLPQFRHPVNQNATPGRAITQKTTYSSKTGGEMTQYATKNPL
jgi:hypothetical protein